MKKSFILIALITVLAAGLFISCNVDGDNGLYMKISNSIAPSGIKIVQFVGFKDDAFYFLSDDGLYKTSKSAGGTSKYAATAGKHFNWAYYTGVDETFYLLNNDGELYKLTGTTLKEDTTYTETYTGLSYNGYLYNSSKVIYLGTGGGEIDGNPNITVGHPLFSGSSMLYVSGDTAKIYNGNTDTGITVSGFDSSSQYKNHAYGFFEITAGSDYMVVQYDDGKYIDYRVTATSKTRVNLETSLGSPQNSYPDGFPTVEYDTGKVLVKTSSTFYKLNYESPAKQDEIGTWASAIKGVNVVNMYKLGTNEIAILTVENGILIVNLSTRTISNDIL